METPISRDRVVDRVKSLAIVLVLIIHSGIYTDPIGSPRWLGALAWGALARPAVPLFFMCTGALLLSPERTLPLRRLFGRNLLRLLLAMWVWALVYKLVPLAAAGTLSAPALWQALKEVLLFRQEFHFYYLHITLLVYLLLPLLRLLVRSAGDRLLDYALALWFALGIVWPSLLPWWPFSLIDGFPLQYQLNMSYAAAGYALLGWRLRRRPPERRTAWALLVLGFLCCFGGTWQLSRRDGMLSEFFFQGMGVPVCLMAAGVWSLLCRAPDPRPLDGAASYLSRASFCVYLVHILFLHLLRNHGFPPAALPPVLAVPLLALALLVLSLAVYEALRRVPWVKRWLV